MGSHRLTVTSSYTQRRARRARHQPHDQLPRDQRLDQATFKIGASVRIGAHQARLVIELDTVTKKL